MHVHYIFFKICYVSFSPHVSHNTFSVMQALQKMPCFSLKDWNGDVGKVLKAQNLVQIPPNHTLISNWKLKRMCYRSSLRSSTWHLREILVFSCSCMQHSYQNLLNQFPQSSRLNLEFYPSNHDKGFPGGSVVKNPPADAGDLGLIPRSGRCPGARKGNPNQYSWLENPMDRRAWWATPHGVTRSQTQVSTHV